MLAGDSLQTPSGRRKTGISPIRGTPGETFPLRENLILARTATVCQGPPAAVLRIAFGGFRRAAGQVRLLPHPLSEVDGRDLQQYSDESNRLSADQGWGSDFRLA